LVAFWKELRKASTVALVFLIGVAVVAIFARYLGTHDFYDVSRDRFLPPGTSGHYLGTDQLGRDIYSGLLLGARVSLIVGVFAAAISASVGSLVGATAGFFGGKIDDILMRITEMFLVLPRFFLVLLVVAFFGANVWVLASVFGLLIWPPTARLVRAEFMTLKERPFAMAATAGGASKTRLIGLHILPNAAYVAIVNSSLQISQVVIEEAGLSFLGLGDPNNVSWGQMLNTALFYARSAWWLAVFPGLAIFLTIIAFNILGDGVNDALNPRLRERRQ
jgi:peptide/nickel transport system permease protein